MKRKRYTDEQIASILQENDAGMPIAELIRKYGIGKSTIARWKSKYGGMPSSEVRRTKQLEDENARLKKIVAEQALDIEAMKNVIKKW